MKYYAVKHGRQSPVITTTWAECSVLVTGFANAIFKSFSSINEAYKYLGINPNPSEIKIDSCNDNHNDNDNDNDNDNNANVSKRANLVQNSCKNPTISKPKQADILRSDIDEDLIASELRSMLILQENENSGDFVLFTDGSCLNQGPRDKSLWKAGSGVYIPSSSAHRRSLKIGVRLEGDHTNQRAELYAVVWICEKIYEFKGERTNFNVIIHSDSRYVIDNLHNNNQKHLDLWNRFKSVLKKLEGENIKVKFEKDLAHSGIEGNEIVDSIAKFMAERVGERN